MVTSPRGSWQQRWPPNENAIQTYSDPPVSRGKGMFRRGQRGRDGLLYFVNESQNEHIPEPVTAIKGGEDGLRVQPSQDGAICRTIQKRTRHDHEAAKLDPNAREPFGTREIAVPPEVSVDFVLNSADDRGIGRRRKKLSPQPAPRRPCSPKKRESRARRQRIDRRAAIRRLGPFNERRT